MGRRPLRAVGIPFTGGDVIKRAGMLSFSESHRALKAGPEGRRCSSQTVALKDSFPNTSLRNSGWLVKGEIQIIEKKQKSFLP